MTNQKILEKAIQKAVDGGWKYPFSANTYEINKYVQARPESIAFGIREEWQDDDEPGHLEGHYSIQELIFNHDFAKALWPETKLLHQDRKMYDISIHGIDRFGNIDWRCHLPKMVIAEDPIKYLGENI